MRGLRVLMLPLFLKTLYKKALAKIRQDMDRERLEIENEIVREQKERENELRQMREQYERERMEKDREIADLRDKLSRAASLTPQVNTFTY